MVETQENKSMVQREEPNNSESERAYVAAWCARVREAQSHFCDDFKRMREDQDFARGKQWADDPDSDIYYTANITLRHISQRTSALYAKNPKAVAEVKDRIEYTAWDGDPDTARLAKETVAMAEEAAPGQAMLLVPEAAAIAQDFNRVQTMKEQRRRFGKTLELVYQHQVDEQVHNFKKMMKRVVRRTGVCGVGYVKLGYQRKNAMTPDVQRQLDDFQERIAHIEMLAANLEDGITDKTDAEAEELRRSMQVLQQEAEVLLRDGLTFDYPGSTSVIVDPKCKNLDGFIGADWIAIEYMLEPDDVQEIYDVDVSKLQTRRIDTDFGRVSASAQISLDSDGRRIINRGLVPVWEVYNRKTRMVLTITDGYSGYLRAPAAPVIDIERFWPVFTVMFNETEHETDIYPPSDVRLMRQMQIEHNTQRQDLRMHRIANRPMYAVAGPLDDSDRSKLQSHPFNAILEMEGLVPGQKISDLLQRMEFVPIDPNVYSTAETFEDILRVVGTAEANLGGTSGATATESSIAESSRLSSLQSNTDDLDEFLTEIARAGGQVLLSEMHPETVRRIAGSGAVWPQLTREELMEEVQLQVEAASSGRPNQAQQIQNAERLYPLLLQIPGIRPAWLAKDLLRRLDDRFDLNEAFDESLPSVLAQNGQTQQSTGDPETDPNSQGAQGQNNTAAPNGTPGSNGTPEGPPALSLIPAASQ